MHLQATSQFTNVQMILLERKIYLHAMKKTLQYVLVYCDGEGDKDLNKYNWN